jgi:hypothetical protein
MKARKTIIELAVVVTLSLALTSMAMAQDLIVVASKAAYQDAQKWGDFLKSQDVPLKHVTPGEFANYKTEQYIILMGGVDEPDGIKDLLKKALSDREFASISKEGNKGMFVKSDVWGEGQEVIIFTGSNRAAAEAARLENKEEWWNEIVTWFDIETGGAKLPGY